MSEKKRKVKMVLIKPKPKDLSITVEITYYDTGEPVTGLKLDDFQINGEEANGYLYAIEEIKLGAYLPTKKETKLYECESVVCNMPQMDSKWSKDA